MRYRALDENGDFTLGNGHAYIEGGGCCKAGGVDALATPHL